MDLHLLLCTGLEGIIQNYKADNSSEFEDWSVCVWYIWVGMGHGAHHLCQFESISNWSADDSISVSCDKPLMKWWHNEWYWSSFTIYIYSPHKTLYNTFDFDETHKGEDLPIWAFCESAESLVKKYKGCCTHRAIQLQQIVGLQLSSDTAC